MNLGYIGLGMMGGALARRLMREHRLRVFDLNRAATDLFATEGAQPVQNPAALARECDIVLTCLPTSAEVRQAIFGPGGLIEGLQPGKLIVDQTTGDPNETRAMAAELKEKGIGLVDAPVSGGPHGAEAGTIAIMAGGPKDQFDKVRPYLETISPNIFHCGDVGAGHTMKLVNNVTSASIRIATFEAVTMGIKNGLTLDTMIEVLSKGSGQSNASKISLPRIRDHLPGTFAMDLMHKDVRLACQLGNDSGVPMMASNLTREIFQVAIQMLGPKASCDDVIKVMERNAGISFTD
ncbi:MAG: NAD(P)-dependent oxidoreductase [Rhodospirillales bacterium CG15_BIG_FIL_POST_REV_8_21_14_020_66_15]|nr:MAG: NAD(P)-dependent oxidoreductase [Rhodospirillales bacterium CG15_BIG_FIL_POST_REV_8_21_14_020_66_15]